jgi:hypothetical protein
MQIVRWISFSWMEFRMNGGTSLKTPGAFSTHFS